MDPRTARTWPTPSTLRRPVSVVLVEPDRTVAATVARLLRHRSMVVHSFASGPEALEALPERPCDLLIAALEMPSPNGWDLLDYIMDLRPETAFIALSANEDPQNVVRAMRRGAVDYVPKPLSLDELVERVTQALDSRTLRRRVVIDRREAGELVTRSPRMAAVSRLVDRVAESPVDAGLILGESGVGKELVARAVHGRGPRRRGPFVAVNVAALPASLVEAQLFGHERGAFTGAVKARPGLLATADGGTLLLDEIGEMPMESQAKLLRVLEERKYYPVGSDAERSVDVRILAATNRTPHEAIARGNLRADLYYRLSRVVIRIPPLRRRSQDIVPLARLFIRAAARRASKPPPTLDAGAELALEAYSWPGNVRELKNVVERAVLLHEGPVLSEAMLGLEEERPDAMQLAEARLDLVGTRQRVVAAVEKEMIERALRVTGGSLSRSAELLNVSRTTLWNRVRRYGIPH